MKKSYLPLSLSSLVPIALASAMLVACGGSANIETQPLTVTGVAATGAPMTNATLQIYGKDGVAVLATPVTIASDGTYSATIPATATGPFVFEVDNGNDKIYSVLANKSSTPVVNVTPLSNLIAAKLSSTGNPFSLASEIAAASTTVSSSNITSATNAIMTALQPLLTALSLNEVNPLSTTFSANGSGFDRLLDSLDVKIEPKGTTSQIEVTLKQSVDEHEDLPKIAFANTESPSALPTVDPTKLVTSGLTPKIQALLDQLTACFAVPLDTRITSGGTTAAHIQSQTCKDAFVGSDPAGYKSGGMSVAKTQHFGGIFAADSTAGVTFSDPKFFYTVGTTVADGPTSGDVVFGFRWKDEYGNFQIEKNVGRIDVADGKLKLVGNQYLYDIGVGPYSQRRNYLNQPNSTFDSVGYSFGLSCYQLNQNKIVGNKIVKVNVTSPRGRVMTFVPNLSGNTCNYGYFVIAFPKNKSGATTVDGMGDPSFATGSGFVRLQSLYETGDTTSTNHPRKLDKSLAFTGGFDGTDLTNAEIEAIPQFGTWKFEYYKTTTNGSLPTATQYFKTTARSLTIDGFKRLVKLPELTADLKTNLTTNTTCYNGSLYCYFKQVTGPFVANWTKSADAGLAPATYMARIYGVKDISVTPTSSWVGYEDTIKFGSSRTTASIRCGQGEASVQSYCTGATPSTADFGTNASIDALDLVSRAPDGTDVSHFHTLKKLQ